MKSDWIKLELSDLADIKMGQSPKSKYYNVDEIGLPFFQGCTEFSEFYPIVKKYCSKPTRIANKDDILMSVRAPVGKLNIAKDECCIGRGLCAITPKNKGRFIYYLLKSNLLKIQSFSTGSTYQSINRKEVNSLTFYVPSVDTQKKIASVLSTYDKLIENNTRRIEILEEMAQRIYKEWFVDFKYPGHENDKLVDSELGMIPKGWTIKKVSEFIDFHIGGGWGKDEREDKYNISGYVIRGTDIPSSKFGSIDNCPLRFHAPTNIKSRELIEGDIVFEVSGGSKDQPLGRAVLINKELLTSFKHKVICASFCKLIRPKKYSEYFYLNLLYIYFNKEIMKYQVQSTGISNFKFQVFINNHQILKPSVDVLEKFTELTKTIFSQIQVLGKKKRNLIIARDYLLPKLISGKVDVSDLDIDTSILDD